MPFIFLFLLWVRIARHRHRCTVRTLRRHRFPRRCRCCVRLLPPSAALGRGGWGPRRDCTAVSPLPCVCVGRGVGAPSWVAGGLLRRWTGGACACPDALCWLLVCGHMRGGENELEEAEAVMVVGLLLSVVGVCLRRVRFVCGRGLLLCELGVLGCRLPSLCVPSLSAALPSSLDTLFFILLPHRSAD
ncbi:hypothetical protein TcCL_Unassigned02837 [Trypanosoma cruzi]|nr:hypothetical protein TcCL_Unassigned02837 [Trypanosoma cruzi]